MTNNKPTADVQISHDLVDSLLKEFVPDIAGQPIEFIEAGWDNETHRVGTDHAVRLPRRREGAPLIENEQIWLPGLAESLPLQIPAPVHLGKPAFGFPWPWSVVPWIDGVPLHHAPPIDTETLIDQLTNFLLALHVPAPANAPVNPYRGVPLSERAGVVAERIDDIVPILEALQIERDPLAKLWAELVETPAWSGEPMWLHGDLHPGNVIVHGSQLAGVIDFGDITSGDPATDLAIGWMTLSNSQDRNKFRQRAAIGGKSIDSDTWKRARAWALSHSTAVLANSDDDPSMRRMATTTLKNVMGIRQS